jgi:hypothetical protein
LFDLGLLLKLFDFWTLFEILLFGIQLFNNLGCEGMFATIEIFTKTITPPPYRFTPTETLLCYTRTTDMKPYMIGAMSPLEVLTILGVG